MELFGTPKPRLNEVKQKFRNSFENETSYENFILGNKLEDIAAYFKKVALNE